MVFQAVRTRFPLRIVAGMTEWGVLQLPRAINGGIGVVYAKMKHQDPGPATSDILVKRIDAVKRRLSFSGPIDDLHIPVQTTAVHSPPERAF